MTIGPSSSAPGSSPTSLIAVNSVLLRNLDLSELTSELTRRLTELENLGLLSAIGQNLMCCLAQKPMPTLSTAGSAPSPGDFGMCTCHLGLGKQAWRGDWRQCSPAAITMCPSHGPTSRAATLAPTTHG